MLRRHAPDAVQAARGSASRVTVAIVFAAALAICRGLPFALWPNAAFDSDQAIVGLMAKHLAEGRAFPVFFYGQTYMLAVQAWLAAPLFWLAGGTSVLLLKLPLLLINGATAALLVWTLVRQAQLSAVTAFAASAFFTLAPPIAGAQLVAAMGGSVEPFLYVLLIWLLRDRPLLCGVISGVGLLHREFTAYGVAALLIMMVLYQFRQWRDLVPRLLLTGLACVTVLEVGRIARPHGDMFGPEMPKFHIASSSSNFEAIAARVQCTNRLEVGANLRWLIDHNLPTLAGTRGRASTEYFLGPSTPASPILWMGLWIGLLVALIRVSALVWTRGTAVPPFLVFLFLVGVLAIAVYAGSCGVRDPTLVRYTLLALLIPVAVAGAYFCLEPLRPLRWTMTLLLAVWMGWSARGYVALVASYMKEAPASPHSIMAAELERRNMHYGYAEYWIAHHINFLTSERVILAPGYPARIYTYDAVVWRAPARVVVQPTPCSGELIGSLWLCRSP